MGYKKGKENHCFKDRTGERHTTNEGYEAEIIEYLGVYNCTIRLNDEHNTILKERCYKSIVKGVVKNPYKRTVFNVGYFGEGIKLTKEYIKVYTAWYLILERCYGVRDKNNTYKDVVVCEEWHNFQNFVVWYCNNYISGFQIDKDILCPECREYSPKFCRFVPSAINVLFIKLKTTHPGIRKKGNRFEVTICKKYEGTFSTIEEASRVYKEGKEKYARSLADKWKEHIDSEIYKITRNYQVEV